VKIYYAVDFNFRLYAGQTMCLSVRTRPLPYKAYLCFIPREKSVETLQSLMHIGHVINSQLNGKDYIAKRRCEIIRRVSKVPNCVEKLTACLHSV
jgi:hypothetical protein